MSNLTDVNGIGEKTAEELAQSGITTLEQLAAVEDAESANVQQGWIDQAKELLGADGDSSQDNLPEPEPEPEPELADLSDYHPQFQFGTYKGRQLTLGDSEYIMLGGGAFHLERVEIKVKPVDEGYHVTVTVDGDKSSSFVEESEATVNDLVRKINSVKKKSKRNTILS